MVGDPEDPRNPGRGKSAPQGGGPGTSKKSRTDENLSQQVEKVVTLLHQLENLYIEVPGEGEGEAPGPASAHAQSRAPEPEPEPEAEPEREPELGPALEEEDDGNNSLLKNDFFEQLAALREREAALRGMSSPRSSAARHEAQQERTPEAPQPPPVPNIPMSQSVVVADPSVWYSGAIRLHRLDVVDKPGVLTKMGLGVAAVLAVMLILPWIVLLMFGKEWEKSLSGILPRHLPAETAGPLAGERGAETVKDKTVAEVPTERGGEGAEEAAPAPGAPSFPSGADGGSQGAALTDGLAAAGQEPPSRGTPQGTGAAGPLLASQGDPQGTQMEAASAPAQKEGHAGAERQSTGSITFSPPGSSPEGGRTAAAAGSPALPGGPTVSSGKEPLRSAATQGLTQNVPADTCESAQVTADQQMIRVSFADPPKAGKATQILVNGIHYQALFQPDGRLTFEAPRLDERAVLHWNHSSGEICHRKVARTDGPPMFHLAVLWQGKADLELEVVEPRSWPGNSRGWITAAQPNLDGTRGAGTFRAFGRAGDMRALMYSAQTDKLGDNKIVGVKIKLAQKNDGSSCGGGEVPYDVYIVRDGGTGQKVKKEHKAFLFVTPPCDLADAGLAESLYVPFRF